MGDPLPPFWFSNPGTGEKRNSESWISAEVRERWKASGACSRGGREAISGAQHAGARAPPRTQDSHSCPPQSRRSWSSAKSCCRPVSPAQRMTAWIGESGGLSPLSMGSSGILPPRGRRALWVCGQGIPAHLCSALGRGTGEGAGSLDPGPPCVLPSVSTLFF